MIKEFTHNDLLLRRGCYSLKQACAFCTGRPKIISMNDIMNSDISIKDKTWFLFNETSLTKRESFELVYKIMTIILPIYESGNTDNKNPRLALEDLKIYIDSDYSKSLNLYKYRFNDTTEGNYDSAYASFSYASFAFNDLMAEMHYTAISCAVAAVCIGYYNEYKNEMLRVLNEFTL